jgi:hypothetical protein
MVKIKLDNVETCYCCFSIVTLTTKHSQVAVWFNNRKVDILDAYIQQSASISTYKQIQVAYNFNCFINSLLRTKTLYFFVL